MRWLRPEYQIPRFGKQTRTEIISSEANDGSAVAGAAPRVPWPSDAIGQITALSALAATRAIVVEEVMSHFTGARRDLATRHLELHLFGEGLYRDADHRLDISIEQAVRVDSRSGRQAG